MIGGDLILRHRTRQHGERQDLRHLREQGAERQTDGAARQTRARGWGAVSGGGGSWHVQCDRAHPALDEGVRDGRDATALARPRTCAGTRGPIQRCASPLSAEQATVRILPDADSTPV